MWSLGPIAFASPWLLAALAALPALWWLLRLTPPAPRRLRFPALRLLRDLPQEDETSARTPLWLLVLRFVLVALAILGLARPLVNPSVEMAGGGPVLIVVDDGWAAARNWTQRQKQIALVLDLAERAGREVALVTTAPSALKGTIEAPPVLAASAMRERAAALAPKSWPVDRRGALEVLGRLQLAGADIWWIADGVEDGASEEFGKRLAAMGALTVVRDAPGAHARMLAPPGSEASGLIARVWRAHAAGPETVLVRGMAEDGRAIVREPVRFEADATEAEAKLALPAELRNRIVRLDIEGEASAGAVVLIDERWRRRPVGLAVLRAGERDLPLLGDLYYLERALSATSEVRPAPLDALLAQSISTILLPDTGALSEADGKALDVWVKAGGVLVRFAGPRIVQGTGDELLPVALRRGGRTLAGAMSWGEPARLQAFAPASPFAGLAIPPDVEVTRQVLAQPSPDLDAKTWARLGDGTPLVTGAKHGNGWLVLFHVTANPEWSTLAYSGLFVEMLQRLVAMGAGVGGDDSMAPLPPLEVLDGFGRSQQPNAGVRPIAGKDFATTPPGPETPPGLYGTAAARRALNLSAGLGKPMPMAEAPSGARQLTLGAESELDLMPWLLTAALLLLLVDLAVSLAMRGVLTPSLRGERDQYLRGERDPLQRGGLDNAEPGAAAAPNEAKAARAGARAGRLGAAALLFGLALTAGVLGARSQARAQSEDPTAAALQALTQTRLAYVRTGHAETDRASRSGLQGLRRILHDRTAVELGDAADIDANTDELSFYPVIYWPVTRAQGNLSPQTAQKLYAYIRNGGMVLFDTQDQQVSGLNLGESAEGGGRALQRLLGRLNLSPLVPVPVDHVLTRAFYLLADFPGRWTGGRVWVEDKSVAAGEAVSSVIVGAHDWAAAWAMDDQGRPQYPAVPGGEKQRESAYRFGVNVVMYALTGNYKLDQVHMRFILERLDR